MIISRKILILGLFLFIFEFLSGQNILDEIQNKCVKIEIDGSFTKDLFFIYCNDILLHGDTFDLSPKLMDSEYMCFTKKICSNADSLVIRIDYFPHDENKGILLWNNLRYNKCKRLEFYVCLSSVKEVFITHSNEEHNKLWQEGKDNEIPGLTYYITNIDHRKSEDDEIYEDK